MVVRVGHIASSWGTLLTLQSTMCVGWTSHRPTRTRFISKHSQYFLHWVNLVGIMNGIYIAAPMSLVSAFPCWMQPLTWTLLCANDRRETIECSRSAINVVAMAIALQDCYCTSCASHVKAQCLKCPKEEESTSCGGKDGRTAVTRNSCP